MVIRKPNALEFFKILLLSAQAVFDSTLSEVKPTDIKVKQLMGAFFKTPPLKSDFMKVQ